MKNKILKGLAIIAFLVVFVSACCLDSETDIFYYTTAGGLAYLAIYLKINDDYYF